MASFWGPGGYLGTLGWPRWLRDRFFVILRLPWGPHFGDIFRVLDLLGALLEALGALLEALGPLLGAFWTNVVIFINFLSYFGVPPTAWDLKKQ